MSVARGNRHSRDDDADATARTQRFNDAVGTFTRSSPPDHASYDAPTRGGSKGTAAHTAVTSPAPVIPAVVVGSPLSRMHSVPKRESGGVTEPTHAIASRSAMSRIFLRAAKG